METVRAFIAVEVGEEICRKLDELQRKLKKVHANVHWVKPRNMHLTLVFLGDIPIEQIGTIKQAIDQACGQRSAFGIQACGTGTFGKAKHPRVIWAGIADCPPLMKLQSRLVQGLHDIGMALESRPFAPHLTLGRVKGIDQHICPLLQKIEKFAAEELGKNRIDHVALMASTLTPHGAEYEVLHRVELP